MGAHPLAASTAFHQLPLRPRLLVRGIAVNEQRRLQAVPPIQQAQDAGRPPTRFSTVGQVANALSISKMTVYRLIDTGALPAYRFGHSFRIPTQAVWDYIRGNKIDPDGVDRATAL